MIVLALALSAPVAEAALRSRPTAPVLTFFAMLTEKASAYPPETYEWIFADGYHGTARLLRQEVPLATLISHLDPAGDETAFLARMDEIVNAHPLLIRAFGKREAAITFAAEFVLDSAALVRLAANGHVQATGSARESLVKSAYAFAKATRLLPFADGARTDFFFRLLGEGLGLGFAHLPARGVDRALALRVVADALTRLRERDAFVHYFHHDRARSNFDLWAELFPWYTTAPFGSVLYLTAKIFDLPVPELAHPLIEATASAAIPPALVQTLKHVSLLPRDARALARATTSCAKLLDGGAW